MSKMENKKDIQEKEYDGQEVNNSQKKGNHFGGNR